METFVSPYQAALEELRKRISADTSLPEPIKAAALEDLGSDHPAEFKSLKAAVAAGDHGKA